MVWTSFDDRINFADTLAADAMPRGCNWPDPRWTAYLGFTDSWQLSTGIKTAL